jgi:hypothetical protein
MKPPQLHGLCAATKALRYALLLAIATKETVLDEWRSTNEDCAAWPTRGAAKGATLAEKYCQRTRNRISSSLISCYRVASATYGAPRPMVRGRVYASWHEAAIHQLEILSMLCVRAISAEAGCRVRLHELECFRLEIDFVDLNRECAQADAYVSNLAKPIPGSATNTKLAKFRPHHT